MARCSRCGAPVCQDVAHIFRGGEERSAVLEKSLGARVTLCGQPLTPAEEKAMDTSYTINERGEMIPVEEARL